MRRILTPELLALGVLLAGSVAAWGQLFSPPRPLPQKGQGVVVEAGSGAPLPGVEVTAIISMIGPGPRRTHLTTGADGSFSFPVSDPATERGYLVFEARKNGYTTASVDFGGGDLAAPQQASYRLGMRRTAELHGRVVDADTGEPVRGARVSSRVAGAKGDDDPHYALTQDDGTFVYSPSGQGPYVLTVSRDRLSQNRPFTSAEATVVDHPVVTTAWPAAAAGLSEAGIQAGPGDVTDVGTIPVKTVTEYRLHVNFPAQGCAAGALYTLEIQERESGKRAVAVEATCGQEWILTEMLPGSYVAYFQPRSPAQGQLSAVVPFEIQNANVSLTGVLKQLGLAARIVGAEGVEAIPEGLEVAITSYGFLGRPTQRSARADASGSAIITNAPPGRTEVAVKGLPRGWVVREVRYGGRVLPRKIGLGQELRGAPVPQTPDQAGAEFAFDGMGILEVVVDDRPGTIRGQLTGTGSNGDVVVVSWPKPEGKYPDGSARKVAVEKDGTFVIQGLPEGQYRVFQRMPGAVGPGATLERQAEEGAAVEVPRGGTVSVTMPRVGFGAGEFP